jgi:hypothetical protein
MVTGRTRASISFNIQFPESKVIGSASEKLTGFKLQQDKVRDLIGWSVDHLRH